MNTTKEMELQYEQFRKNIRDFIDKENEIGMPNDLKNEILENRKTHNTGIIEMEDVPFLFLACKDEGYIHYYCSPISIKKYVFDISDIKMFSVYCCAIVEDIDAYMGLCLSFFKDMLDYFESKGKKIVVNENDIDFWIEKKWIKKFMNIK